MDNITFKDKILRFIKINLFSYIVFILIISLLTIIYSILIYNDKLSFEKTFKFIPLLIGIISFFALGFTSGIISMKNGLTNGLFSALIIILISLLFNLFIKNNFNSTNLFKIALYLLISSIGGIIGVNLKTNK